MRTGRPRTPLAERFWRMVSKSDGCWEWNSCTGASGYGQVRPGGSTTRVAAHRVAWELERGTIPPGLLVCHRCDNRKCVRPDHLFLGTVQDNDRDRDAKGRTAKGLDFARSKLNPEAVLAIREGRARGRSAKELAKEFKVSPSAIWLVWRREIWKHVKEAANE